MARGSKILRHPDKDKIIAWLAKGVPVRDIEKSLKEMYPRKKQAHLRVSHSCLQFFKGDYLNLKGQVLKDVKEQSSSMRAWAKKKELEREVHSSSAYKDAISSLAEKELDVQNELMKIYTVIESRIEVLFDRLSNSENVPSKDVEKSLQGYLDQFMKVLDQHKKYVEGYKETTEHNININIVNDQVQVIRDSIREALIEVDPSAALKFMNILNIKMRELAYSEDGHAYILDESLRG